MAIAASTYFSPCATRNPENAPDQKRELIYLPEKI